MLNVSNYLSRKIISNIISMDIILNNVANSSPGWIITEDINATGNTTILGTSLNYSQKSLLQSVDVNTQVTLPYKIIDTTINNNLEAIEKLENYGTNENL